MARYQVHLETARGHAMAHVLEMPGCFVRASGREEALRSLPAAIGEYQRRLRRHREPVPPMDEPLELEVAEEISDLGPFDPGDPAALFESGRAPITIREIEACLRLMANSRTDLLEVVGDLSDEVLDWEPAPDAFTIRSVLRHLGNAEEWYVSRLVSPETLPAEWDDDEALAIIDFLDEPAVNEEPVPTEDEEVDSQSTEVESAPTEPIAVVEGHRNSSADSPSSTWRCDGDFVTVAARVLKGSRRRAGSGRLLRWREELGE